jgi:hypothetical protein
MSRGLSPFARGNTSASLPTCTSTGSIPVCTGNYNLDGEFIPQTRSIPVCTGNRDPADLRCDEEGSIPVCTGESGILGHLRLRREVGLSPLVRGTRRGLVGRPEGLSPLVRGNIDRPAGQGAVGGTIPGRAGEHEKQQTNQDRYTDYPRSWGGDNCVRKLSHIAMTTDIWDRQ